MYADLDSWLALVEDDNRLSPRAEQRLTDHGDDLEGSLATLTESSPFEERFGVDQERAVTAIPEQATYCRDPDVVYQASAYIDGDRPRSTRPIPHAPRRPSSPATAPTTT